MKLQFFGHAAFGITSSSGLRVLLDPYEPGAFGGQLNYKAIPGKWDIVIVSHDHLDHNYIAPSFGAPKVVKGDAVISGVEVKTLIVKHGDAGGTVNFDTRVSWFAIDGVRFLHPGDAGKPLTADYVSKVGPIDVLFAPVGGHFTMGPPEAPAFIRQVAPKVAIPMHYKTPLVKFPIRPVDDFLKAWGKERIQRLGSGEVRIASGALPAETELWVMPMLMA